MKGDDVPWTDYGPEVKTRIDSMAAAKNCPGLRAEFDTADENSDATLAGTGTYDNVALMSYIDDKMRDAGCHG